MPSPLLDARQIRRGFDRAAAGYSKVALLQREVEQRLMEQLEYVTTPPSRILDVGCGTGTASLILKKRWPKAQVVSLDISLSMLREAKHSAGRWRPQFSPLCGDTQALPFAVGSFDLVFSNLCMPWVEALSELLAQWRNVLTPGGFLLCSSVGANTLEELNEAFTHTDPGAVHIHPFAPILDVGDALLAAGFRDPVVLVDRFTLTYPDVHALLRDLRDNGAGNAARQRRKTLTGKSRLQQMMHAYEAFRQADGRLPASAEIIYAHAFAPEPGQPIRNGGHEMAAVPLSRIPIRRKSG